MDGNWAVIEISDQGPGISKSIQEKLMTYGATTAGNGIGLAWARDQLNIDGGRLEIYSMNPAIFKIYLRPDSTN
jgi:sensor histidine kinase regulating citrate/malate metabolism